MPTEAPHTTPGGGGHAPARTSRDEPNPGQAHETLTPQDRAGSDDEHERREGQQYQHDDGGYEEARHEEQTLRQPEGEGRPRGICIANWKTNRQQLRHILDHIHTDQANDALRIWHEGEAHRHRQHIGDILTNHAMAPLAATWAEENGGIWIPRIPTLSLVAPKPKNTPPPKMLRSRAC